MGCNEHGAKTDGTVQHRVERYGVSYLLPLALGPKFREYWFYTAQDGARVLHGPYRTFSSNGTLVYEAHYRNGVLHGIETIWTDSGVKLYEDEYKEGEVQKKSTFSNGVLSYIDAIVEEPGLGKIHKVFSDGRWYYITQCRGYKKLVNDLGPHRCE